MSETGWTAVSGGVGTAAIVAALWYPLKGRLDYRRLARSIFYACTAYGLTLFFHCRHWLDGFLFPVHFPGNPASVACVLFLVAAGIVCERRRAVKLDDLSDPAISSPSGGD